MIGSYIVTITMTVCGTAIGLFIIAMKTARRALELLLLARRAGVNGI